MTTPGNRALDFKNKTIIFCDGACSGNPGPGGWAAIVATSDGRVVELGGGAKATTNNRMEMIAAMEAIRFVEGARASGKPSLNDDLIICTDSVYVIRGATQWVFAWKKRGWKNAAGADVANQDLWEDLSRIIGARKKTSGIDWKYVRGHTGVPGNERCDEIAVGFSKGEYVNLYRGPLLQYSVAIHDIPENTDLPEMKERGAEPKAAPHSYLSLIGGIPARHASWGECERRVKGQSGAKFKKAMTPDEEIQILKSWGVDPAKLK